MALFSKTEQQKAELLRELNNYKDIAFTMDMTVEGVSTTVEAKATVTYENPGQPVTVTPPEGYQDFEEISMDDSLL